MVHVFHSRTNMVIVRREKNLRLVLEAAVSLTMQNASVVALEFAADFIAATVKRIFAFYALFPLWRIFPARLLFKRIFHSILILTKKSDIINKRRNFILKREVSPSTTMNAKFSLCVTFPPTPSPGATAPSPCAFTLSKLAF